MASAGRLRFGRAAPAVPTLNAVSDTFGGWSATGRGGVRLNGTLGLIATGTPTSWKLRMKPGGGTAAHWTFPGSLVGGWWTVSEGTSALTPMPSSAGQTARLSDGTYTFEIIGTNAVGDSATVEFTRTIDANASNIGNNLGSDSSVAGVLGGGTIATFQAGTTVGQRKIFLSKGIEEREILLQGFEFTSEVVLRDADPAVPSNILLLQMTWVFMGAWTRFITVDGLTNDSASLGTRNCRILINKTSDMVFRNLQMGRTQLSQNVSLFGLFMETAENERIIIEDCKFYWMCIGMIVWGTDHIVRRCTGRWLHARLITVSDNNNVLIEDCANLSPRYISGSGLHAESIQRADNATIVGMTVRRIEMYHADATWGAQGLFMGRVEGVIPNPVDVQIYAIAYTGWSYRGIAQSTCAGTNRLRNFTLIKANTGDGSTCPPEYSFVAGGPWNTFSAPDPTDWTGTYNVDHGYVGDVCFVEPIPPDTSYAVPIYDTPTMRVKANTYTAGDFLNGNPKPALEAITFSQWEAMSDEDVIAAHRAALIPGANLSNADYYTGAFLPDGSWNEN